MGDALGVIGGGQLGRYFVLAAQAMGYRVVVLEPDPQSPAGAVADEHIMAPYDDPDALAQLANLCCAATVEFENPSVAALELLERQIVVRPSSAAVAIVQDRRSEKRFCSENGLAIAPFAIIEAPSDIAAAIQQPLFPGIIKTARLGYDGKGQRRIDHAEQLADAFVALGSVPCVLEQLVPLDAELSVVIARGADGEMAMFVTTHNVHINGILDSSTAPYADDVIARKAQAVAVHIAKRLNYVGVLGVEFFVSDTKLLVNEIAPRPHNSAHWTLNAARTSQFEQQVRTLVDAPLGDSAMTHPAVAMVNLLGDRWQHGELQTDIARSNPNAHLHLYGKSEARPGRKMGHLTVVGNRAAGVLAAAHQLRDDITVQS